ncbi:MAG: hypothetical protein ACE5HW_01475, partial [Candidatus Methanofastidiosia archaeon]
MKPKTSLFILLLSSLIFTSIPYFTHPYPLSWDVWYHIRIAEETTHGLVLWDYGSFGPEGRPHTYPPLFHIFMALSFEFVNLFYEFSMMELARILPLILNPLQILSIYFLLKKLFDERIALLASFLYILVPTEIVRGNLSTPQNLAQILIPLGFLGFTIENRRGLLVSILVGGALIMTHGLSAISYHFTLLTFSSFLSLKRRELFPLKKFMLLLFFSLAISSPFLYHLSRFGFVSKIPFGYAQKISLYPKRLGWILILLAFFGIFNLKNLKKKNLLIISMLFANFLLTLNHLFGLSLLPYRFVEFLPLPLSVLGAFTLNILSKKRYTSYLVILILLGTFPKAFELQREQIPQVTEEEFEAIRFLKDNSLEGIIVMSGWFNAPIIASISKRVPVKGAYESGSFTSFKRTADVDDFYNGKFEILK